MDEISRKIKDPDLREAREVAHKVLDWLDGWHKFPSEDDFRRFALSVIDHAKKCEPKAFKS